MKLYLSREISSNRAVIDALESWAPTQATAWLNTYKRGDWKTVYDLLPPSYFTHCAHMQIAIRYDIAYAIEHGWTDDPEVV